MKIEGLGWIYKITNPINQIYVGQSEDVFKRMDSYRNLNCIKQPLLYKSIKHYGWESHKIDILTLCDLNEIDKKEIALIKENNSYYYANKEIGLNILEGGKGAIPKGGGRKRGSKNKKLRKVKHVNEMNEREKERWDKCHKARWVSILRYSKSGDFLDMWENIDSAINILKIKGDVGSIVSCAKGKNNFKTAGGFQWRYWAENYPLKIAPVIKPIGVPIPFKVINTTTLEETIFDNVEQFTKVTGVGYNTLYAALNLRFGNLKRKNLRIVLLPNSSLEFSDKFFMKQRVESKI